MHARNSYHCQFSPCSVCHTFPCLCSCFVRSLIPTSANAIVTTCGTTSASTSTALTVVLLKVPRSDDGEVAGTGVCPAISASI